MWAKPRRARHTIFENPNMDLDLDDYEEKPISKLDVPPDDYKEQKKIATTKVASDYSEKDYIKLLNNWIKQIIPTKTTIKEHLRKNNDGLGYYIVFGAKNNASNKVDMIVHKHNCGIGKGILFMFKIPFTFDILPPGKIIDIENQKISYDYVVNQIMRINKKVFNKGPIIYDKMFNGVQRQFIIYMCE